MFGILDFDRPETKTKEEKLPPIDFADLEIRIGEHIQSLKEKWHVNELPRLKNLIRSTLVGELSRLEERKYIRRERIELERKKQEREEEEEAAAEASV